ncbi:MAG: DUF928 domain-containing protein [Chloroflexaceae bacterium]|nr:DUF928 domain-containing protein [Chloroflexaceae bacterium]
MQKLLKLTLVSLIGAGLSAGPARADYTPPPEDRPTGTQTAPSSSRSGSCQTAHQGHLALLAPQLHLGRTTSTHPSFVWYVPSQSPVSLEFRLFEPGTEGKAPQLWGRPLS